MEAAKPPRALWSCSGVVCGGLVYSLGGFDRRNIDSVSDVCSYHPDLDSWVPGQPLPCGLHGTAAVEHMGSIYVCGGGTTQTQTTSASLLMLDPRTLTWAALPLTCLPLQMT